MTNISFSSFFFLQWEKLGNTLIFQYQFTSVHHFKRVSHWVTHQTPAQVPTQQSWQVHMDWLAWMLERPLFLWERISFSRLAWDIPKWNDSGSSYTNKFFKRSNVNVLTTAVEILLKTKRTPKIWFHQVREYGFRNNGNLSCGIHNRLWHPECSSRTSFFFFCFDEKNKHTPGASNYDFTVVTF